MFEVTSKTRHLLHLAGLALFFYLFAFSARYLGAMVAFMIFLPVGLVFECRFWWKLFTPSRDKNP